MPEALGWWTQLGLAWPWALALLPLPLLLRRLAPEALPAGAALRWPRSLALPGGSVARADGRATASSPHPWAGALVWLLLVLALARPWWLEMPAPVAAEGREFVVALDLSGSMQVVDMDGNGHAQTRLQAAMETLDALLEARHGDRVGLIVFATHAFWLAPPSYDTSALRALLTEAEAGLAGQRTAIGDAIGLALQRGASAPVRERVLVLLTDGRNTAGSIGPRGAAERAARAGLRIHTVGIGREGGTGEGAGEAAGFDAETLRAVAGLTGGQYLEAGDVGSLAMLVGALDRLEPVRWDRSLGLRRELYPWPLALALLATALLLTAARRHQSAEARP